MPVKKLIDFLESNKIKYEKIKHPPGYTAQKTAAAAHVPGRQMAKTVMVKIDGEMAMAVLPATYQVDFDLLRKASGGNKVELASEAEFKGMFPNCEIGAMPPFGNLWGMNVYVAKTLAEDTEIAFNAGSHSELIRMAYKDFKKSVKPSEVKFSD